MLRQVGIAAAAALAAAPLTWAGTGVGPRLAGIPALGAGSATARLSDDRHGAKPVALTIRLHAELQCGRLMSRSITVSLPASMHVPASLPRTAVLVAGKAAGSVGASGARVVIHPAVPKPGVICDVIGPGVVAIKFTRLAGLGNPRRAGSYTFGVVAKPRGGEWHGVLAIH